jgi:ABC-2 type transport system permease protein
VLGFATVAGERESGTLRQLLGTGVSPSALVLGKAAGLVGVLALVLVPTVAIGALAISWSSVTEVWESDTSRTVWLMAAYLLWATLWVGLTVTVSMVSRTTRLALVTLLAIWMGSVLVAPRAVLEVAARLHPTPSATSFERAMAADLADRTEVERRLDERRRELFALHGVSSQAAVPGFAGISFQEGEEYANGVFDRHYGPLHDTFERQNRLAQWAGFLAPSLAIRSLSMGLAGSDFAHHRHFATAAEAYRRDLQRALNADIAMHQQPGQTYLADAALWASIPDFNYRAPGVGWVFGRQVPALMALGTWVLCLSAALLWAARRVQGGA